AVFDVAGRREVLAVLADAGLAAEDGAVVVRRELTRSGRHRAFVNDCAVTVGLLERLGDQLVDVHGQHEHQRLLEPARQLDLLDRFASAEAARERVGAAFAAWRAAAEELAGLRAAARDRAQREDLLRFQVSELDAARLRVGEEDELRRERRRLQHAERLAKGLAEASALLAEDPEAAAGRLARAARIFRDLGRLDPGFEAPAALLDGASAQVEEALLGVRGLRASIEAEPGRLEALDDRIDALARLKRKYGDSEELMLAHREAAAAELERLVRHEETQAEAGRRVDGARHALDEAAAILGQRRREAATRLGPLVERELRALGMERARFEIGLHTLPPGEMSARGAERAELVFSANPGEDLRPLARIASGGELSRTMLALQVVLARVEPVPTMVFDEVDAGVGGGAAGVVADKLAAVAAGRQVLCVTHLAQVAARGQHHLRVAKSVRGGRTRARVAVLGAAERIDEVARMLGGEPPSETARRHARELFRG
ncbi:MAG TPA: DNA repair protein RecN, partial [Methylomirabilota bacterium]|nr:DNA repair protein RecN [Methylomirabilota bacterium]